MPTWLLPLILLGAALALGGGYFDDAWHTERGRDSFFIAPHIAIYGGITLAASALGIWVVLALREGGWRVVIAHRPLALAVLSVGVTLASAPIDNAWHLAFGRDAVAWSPPHVLGIVGTAGLAASLLIELASSQSRAHRLLVPVAGAMLLSAFNFLVFEYETDVPQFDAVWYLPVLTLCSSFALGLIRLAGPARFGASKAALVHLGFMLAVCGLLMALSFDTPKLPLLIVPALVLDLAFERRVGALALGVLFPLALFAAYVLTLDLLGEGVKLDARQVAVGLPLAVLCAAVVFLLLGLGGRAGRASALPAAAAALTALALLWPAGALAHDPGQGPDAGSLDLAALVRGERMQLRVTASGRECRALRPRGIVARRAGQVMRAPLRGSGCAFRGSLRLPESGRWFVYADLVRGGDAIESWLPVKRGAGEASFVRPDRFAYEVDRKQSSTIKWIAGGAMYALVLAFLFAIALMFRSVAGQRNTPVCPSE